MARSSKKKHRDSPAEGAGSTGILTTDYVVSGLKATLIQAAIILAAGLWIYWPALHGDWLWDDALYITQNPLLNDPDRIWKAWFQPGSFVEYYPIEQTVQWMQWKLWGNDTFGYHLTNVGLHLISAFLVWRLLGKLGLRLAWLGGLIFAVHPMMVESVAWIAELKNTLSLPPFLLAMCFWIDHEEHKRPRDYLLALGFFLVAMLCKIGMAPFFSIILLYAWWKRGRIGWRDVLVSAPFCFIAVALSLINISAGILYVKSQSIVLDAPEIGGSLYRLALAGQTLSVYFVKCIWPLNPMPLYPQWEVDSSSPVEFLPWLVLAGVIYWLWRRRESWGRHALLGLGFFILFLGPFLGFIPITYMNLSWVMDHFLYIPIIGIIGIVVAGIEQVDARLSTTVHPLSSGVLTIILALLAFESHWYASAFTGPETFWTYAVDRNPGSWGTHDYLGEVYLNIDQPDKAREQYEEAIQLRPGLAQPYTNLATAFLRMGRPSDAAEALRQALKREPNAAEANNNLALLLARAGRVDEAISHLEVAIRKRPHYFDGHNNLGHVLLQAGRKAEAIEQFQLALKIDPSNADALSNLADLQTPPAPASGH